MHPKEEITFVIIKPDGVRRGLSGEIIRRIEQTGLKIVAIEMFQPSHDQIDNHYPKADAWIKRLGEKTANTYKKFGFDLATELGTTDLLKIGKMVRGWLVEYMTSAPLIRMVVKGTHVISMMRKMAGTTMPADAELGTIRGDFSVDSAAAANRDKRAVHNILHASETPEEAQHEIEHWFGGREVIHDYQRTDEMI
ncbi:MAG: nucleoside-diphosphate kinase [Candidatus Kerfeldbacteria bacterium RIFCSPHIGHO2_02_FULL_42_14]|uniref:nucleoside-diphosphate kinase n=1 Tax=Candidatus Kerfeldbacteria bacterium RIFCSPHIGHO2_02_FULL_42_14 TaxID=1798540 RepID=A0A1G2AT33_9BACT|nr:MAG: nucleoside-diphosphate kinase [Candidatus Kerfeldbacteria bacterium RIFCSPHIGHO2_02_FULL_42_14]OGY80448.1 MAG: nucleoside-diphosphate kinase [Candidatus Kerfeldbacteria bacterium RIFCSPHIGHO2_12_FULL_42_13]OGY83878.1 MAG: nucleoside-diphosphate kinase [Candidatus Kerfeldbacteria bacterium RIFCSPLOWO2_02_FULL_42_19]OGY86583.1 MAG: nucleoside-diphosphate kinase [Candidatus Kerfeldbacteria bacterium RIFCSPLOWO2_12_FULL_43_9]